MVAFLADENFNRHIVRGLLRRNPSIDIVIAQKVGLRGASDAALLDWAAGQNRVVLSHDVRTLSGLATQRIRQGLAMAGVLLVNRNMPLRRAIEQIALIWECSGPGDWNGVVDFIAPEKS